MRLFVLLMFVFAQLINGSEDVNSVVQPRSLFHRHRHESSTESPFESTTKKHYFNIFHRKDFFFFADFFFLRKLFFIVGRSTTTSSIRSTNTFDKSLFSIVFKI